MKNLLFIFLVILTSPVFSQEQDSVYTTVDKLPSYPGGIMNMSKFLGKNLRYPANAVRHNIEGKTVIQFVVEKDGRLTSIEINSGFDNECDQEAMRVVAMMPKWIPAELHENKVRYLHKVPIIFKLAH